MEISSGEAFFFLPIAAVILVGGLLTVQGRRDRSWALGLGLIGIGLALALLSWAWVHNGCFETWNPCSDNGLDTGFIIAWVAAVIGSIIGTVSGAIKLQERRRPGSG